MSLPAKICTHKNRAPCSQAHIENHELPYLACRLVVRCVNTIASVWSSSSRSLGMTMSFGKHKISPSGNVILETLEVSLA